jgi:hypothetical protein
VPGYESLVNFPPLAGAVVASTAALVDITAAPIYSIPANTLTSGSTIRVTAYGRWTNGATATNLTLGIYYGGTGGTLLAAIPATALTVSTTNAAWHLEYVFTVRSVGATGTVFGHGWVDLNTSLSAATHLPIPSTANAAVTVDTTTSKTINIGATLSQVTGSPTVTCDHIIIENLSTLA